MLENNKISIIVPINNEETFKEAAIYINRLKCPSGYELDIQPVYDCKSIAQAHNLGMLRSNASYKIYMKENVSIINPNFLNDILTIFKSSSKIGIIGVVGAVKLSRSGIMNYSERVGNLYAYDSENTCFDNYAYSLEDGLDSVECVDGMIMATRADIKWREDLFDGQYFYDLAQCFEYRKLGFDVVVPNQTKPWCAYETRHSNMWTYDSYRKIFISEYLEKN